MATDLKSLQHELTANLTRAERYRRIIRFIKIPVYTALVLWMLCIVCMPIVLPFLIKKGIATYSPEIQHNVMVYFMATIGVYTVLVFLFSRAQRAFGRIEYETTNRIVRELFPMAKMDETPQPVADNILKSSMFFGRMGAVSEVPALVFSSLELPSETRKLHVVDLGVTHNGAEIRALLRIYVELFRQIFKSRAEMASYLFRGMFAWAELEKRIPGSIVIMPDHIEDKLGYLAKHVQTMKNRGDMKLLTLEDVEFERLFAVYATDEVLARYVLTPAMMSNITELQKRYGRDIMISFNANRFCIAVSMPDGFLNLRGKAIKNGNIVEEIYNDIRTTQSILTQIKLDKVA